MNVQHVPPDYIHQVWPKIEGYLDNAAQFSRGSITAAQAKIYLLRGDWQLLIDVNPGDINDVRGAAVINFTTTANDRVGYINLIGGKMIATPENFEQLIQYAKAHGATCIQGAARPAIVRLWRKLFGFYEKYTIVELKI